MARPLLFSPDDILVAAEEVFARKGYGATSLRQLMAAAGVSTTAFYARFESKEAVLIALAERLVRDIHQAEAGTLPQVTTIDQGIERGVDILVSQLSSHRRLVGIILTEGAASPTVRGAVSRAYQLLVALVAAQLPAARASRTRAGRARAEALAWATVGALNMHIIRWAVFDELTDAALRRALITAARTVLPATPPGRRPRSRSRTSRPATARPRPRPRPRS